MSFRFNALTGMLDLVGANGGAGTPGGSDGQIQYNNAGAFGGASGVNFDNSVNWFYVGNSGAIVFPTGSSPQYQYFTPFGSFSGGLVWGSVVGSQYASFTLNSPYFQIGVSTDNGSTIANRIQFGITAPNIYFNPLLQGMELDSAYLRFYESTSGPTSVDPILTWTVPNQLDLEGDLAVTGLAGYPVPAGFFATESAGTPIYDDGEKVIYRIYAHFDTGGDGTWSPYAETNFAVDYDSEGGPVASLSWNFYTDADYFLIVRNYYNILLFPTGYFGPGFTTYVTTADNSYIDDDADAWQEDIPAMEFRTQFGENIHHVDYVRYGITWGLWTDDNARIKSLYLGTEDGPKFTGGVYKAINKIPLNIVCKDTDESLFGAITTGIWVESDSSGNGAGLVLDGSNANSGIAWIVFGGFEAQNRGGYFFGLNNSGNIKIAKLNPPYDAGSFSGAKDNAPGFNFDRYGNQGVNALPYNYILDDESFMAQFTIAAQSTLDYTAPLRLVSSDDLMDNPVDGCFERTGANLYFTDNTPTRSQFVFAPTTLSEDYIVVADSSGRLVSSGATVPSGLANLGSGTYTPTLTSVANVSASTAYQCQYLRVGNVVTVSGKLDIDPTTTLTSTQLGISLPVSSNFGAAQDCGGVAFAPSIAAMGAAILADVTNDRAQLQYVCSDITNQSMFFTFTYEVI